MNAESGVGANGGRFPKITDRDLEDLQKRIGVKIENMPEPWCCEATRDNIRHYAHGIGDDNPLWCDPDYASTTRYGGLIALPSFLFSTSRIMSGYVGGLRGIHAMWAGSDWSWHKTIYRNDEISCEAWLSELIPHETRFSGRAIQQVYHVEFFNQHGDNIAGGDSWCFRTERDKAREDGTKYAATYPAVATRSLATPSTAKVSTTAFLPSSWPHRGYSWPRPI